MELVGYRILIVDDEPLFLQTTGQLLRKEGADCETAVDAQSAMRALEGDDFDLILTDLNMPGNLRWELLKAGRQRWSHVPMIVITGVPTLPSAIESLRLGVTDYLLKPVGFPELLASIRRAIAGHGKQLGSIQADSELPRSAEPQEEMLIGDSPAMVELKSMMDRIAHSSAHVLIVGETGTGKELVGKIVHRQSSRRDRRFEVVDCVGAEADQLSTTLFGTANQGQPSVPGLLDRAKGGCVFLDEVAELPSAFQPKLLRALQNQEFVPVGGQLPNSMDVRFISATQRRMETEIAHGRFRQDLYYRLGVLSLTIPPLRQRGDDVLLLAQHFWRTISPLPSQKLEFDDDARQALLNYNWPGNVRELRNVVQRIATLSADGRVGLAALPHEIVHRRESHPASELATQDSRSDQDSEHQPMANAGNPAHAGNAAQAVNPVQAGNDVPLNERRAELERAYLLELIESSRGNVTHAARKANMSRQGFHKLLKRHGLSASKYRN